MASAVRRALGVAARLVLTEARQRALPVVPPLAADLAREREPVEAGDLALALEPGRVAGRQRLDQLPDPVPQVEREVRRRGAHQLPHVLDGDPVLRPEALR